MAPSPQHPDSLGILAGASSPRRTAARRGLRGNFPSLGFRVEKSLGCSGGFGKRVSILDLGFRVGGEGEEPFWNMENNKTCVHAKLRSVHSLLLSDPLRLCSRQTALRS